jgi:hypothetical protein
MHDMIAQPTKTCAFDDKVDAAARALSDSITSALADRPSAAFLCLILSAFLGTANLL